MNTLPRRNGHAVFLLPTNIAEEEHSTDRRSNGTHMPERNVRGVHAKTEEVVVVGGEQSSHNAQIWRQI